MSKMLSKMNLISVVQQLPKEDIKTIQGYVEMIEEENQELKKQLENCYCNRTDCSSRIKDSKKYDSLVQTKETQQKEFIEWLEAMNIMYQNEYKDVDVADHYNCVEKKYKEIIGLSDEKES